MNLLSKNCSSCFTSSKCAWSWQPLVELVAKILVKSKAHLTRNNFCSVQRKSNGMAMMPGKMNPGIRAGRAPMVGGQQNPQLDNSRERRLRTQQNDERVAQVSAVLKGRKGQGGWEKVKNWLEKAGGAEGYQEQTFQQCKRTQGFQVQVVGQSSNPQPQYDFGLPPPTLPPPCACPPEAFWLHAAQAPVLIPQVVQSPWHRPPFPGPVQFAPAFGEPYQQPDVQQCEAANLHPGGHQQTS